MALNGHLPFQDAILAESTTSIAATPVAATAVSPCSGYIRRGYAAAGGTTTGTITVAVTVNGGSDIFGGALTVAAGTGARAGSSASLPMQGSSAVFINEGDQITFTPSGGTGSSIPGAFTLVIRPL
jgi:hypothetical protein